MAQSAPNKHVLNDPATLVLESLRGLVTFNPTIKLDEPQRVVYRDSPSASDRVSIISGGGSGHEPAHAGFVGQGLLSAAVCGNVFASPNVAQIRRALDLVTGDQGTLVVVMNYTGDALHFGLAAEHHRSRGTLGDVRVLMVGDDVAVGRAQGDIVGRRGLAGTVLVYKIAAALAQQGGNLDQVENIARYICARIGTIGVGLDHCHVPGTKAGASHLAENELELGMGIHNEPGTDRIHIPSTAQLVENMLQKITDTVDPDRSFVPFTNDNDEVVLLVNNLGAISEIEMMAITGEATSRLRSKGYIVKRVLSGTYMTSLNMPGFSLSLLLLPKYGEPYTTELILSLLDAPASAPGWAWYAAAEPCSENSQANEPIVEKSQEPQFTLADKGQFISAIRRACEALIAAEPEITMQDQIAGDGDAGLTLKAGALALMKAIEIGKIRGENAIEDIKTIAEVVEADMGGTSGALYSIFFAGISTSLRQQANGGVKQTSHKVWSDAASTAKDTLYRYTRARPPSRTLVDPLEAFVKALATSSLSDAANKAHEAAEMTREIIAKAGRGAYINQDNLRKRSVPDPGAWGVWCIVDALRGNDAPRP